MLSVFRSSIVVFYSDMEVVCIFHSGVVVVCLFRSSIDVVFVSHSDADAFQNARTLLYGCSGSICLLKSFYMCVGMRSRGILSSTID